LQPLHCLERELVQPAASVRNILDDLIAHAPFPEFLEVVGHASHRFVVRIAGKEQGDLVRPVNHTVVFHVDCAIAALIAGRARQDLLALDLRVLAASLEIMFLPF